MPTAIFDVPVSSQMTGSTSTTAGTSGLVPAPAAGDQGKALFGDGTWKNVADPSDMSGATSSTVGTHGLVPAPSAGDQNKVLFGDGTWKEIAEPDVFTGATTSSTGTSGLVPAPGAGTQKYFLKGDGTWDVPPGTKLIEKTLDTVTNTSGAYTHTTTIADVTADMKAVMIELGDPSAFLADITITPADGSITLSCSSVKGTSTVKVGLLFVAGASSITSNEFDVLAGRIGTLGDLNTTAKTSLVAAINENAQDVADIGNDLDTINSKFTYKNLGTFSSESSLATALSAEIANMSNYTQEAIYFVMSSATTSFKAEHYQGMLSRAIDVNHGSLYVNSYNDNNNPNDVIGSFNNAWGFNNLNSKILNMGIRQVYANYSEAIKTHVINIGRSVGGILLIQSWNGHAEYSGMYMVRANTSGGSITPIKEATGANVSYSGYTITVEVSTQWTSVHLFELVA